MTNPNPIQSLFERYNIKESDLKQIADAPTEPIAKPASKLIIPTNPKEFKRLSNSSLGTFIKCPKQFECAYIRGIRMPPPGAMLQGTTYHKGLEVGYKYKRDRKENPPLDIIKDAASDGWNKRVKDEEGIDWGGEDPGRLKDEAITVVEKYAQEVLPTIEPIDVEQFQNFDIDGIPFVRVRDLITPTGVIDHKLASSKYNANQIYTDLQSLSYTYPNGGKFEYHVGVKGRANSRTAKREIQIIDFSRTQDDINWWVGIVKSVYAQIKTGIFPPHPGGYFCNPTWCGFYYLCHEVK